MQFELLFACCNGQLEVANWLNTFRPNVINNLNLIIRNKNKKLSHDVKMDNLKLIIRNKKEQLWYKMQYLIELSENKNHKLYKLSLDIIWLMSLYI